MWTLFLLATALAADRHVRGQHDRHEYGHSHGHGRQGRQGQQGQQGHGRHAQRQQHGSGLYPSKGGEDGRDLADELQNEKAFSGGLDKFAQGLGSMKAQLDQLKDNMGTGGSGKPKDAQLEAMLNNLAMMADMPHQDHHIVGTGMNKMYDLRYLARRVRGTKPDKPTPAPPAKTPLLAANTAPVPPAAAPVAAAPVAPAAAPVAAAPVAPAAAPVAPAAAPVAAAPVAPAAAPVAAAPVALAAAPVAAVPVAPAAPVAPVAQGVQGDVQQLRSALAQDVAMVDRVATELAQAPASGALSALEQTEQANQQMLAKVLAANKDSDAKTSELTAQLKDANARADKAEAYVSDLQKKSSELQASLDKSTSDVKAAEAAQKAQATRIEQLTKQLEAKKASDSAQDVDADESTDELVKSVLGDKSA